MSNTHKDQKGHAFLDGVRAAAHSVRKSPQMVRKGFKKAKSKFGGSKQYSTLSECENNGWLHTDDKVMLGVPYKVQYLGSIEVNYIPSDPSVNNAWALEAMRTVREHAGGKGEPHLLTISTGRITLTTGKDNESVVMRHSTSRIAYSTVDHESARLFSYVALPKKQTTPLCHVFLTKSPKTSYEMTFTCAQAFEQNFKLWQDNREAALIKATASEAGDVEPIKALPSPRPIRKVLGSNNGRSSPLAVPGAAAASSSEKEPVAVVAAADPGSPKRIVELHELEVEEEEEDLAAVEAYFTSLTEARTEPNMLAIGVEPEHFNNAPSVASTE